MKAISSPGNSTSSSNGLASIKVINAECEGECRIRKISCIRIQKLKVFLTVILSILTCFIIALMLMWSKTLRLRMLFVSCSFDVATYFYIENSDGTVNIVKRYEGRDLDGNPTPFFFNRYLKYYFDRLESSFKPYEYEMSVSHEKIHVSLSKGINEEKAKERLESYGECFLNIPIPHPLPWIVTQLLNPFYIIQYGCSVLWVFEGYIMFAITMTVVSVVVTIISYIFMRISLKKLQKMAHNDVKLKIFRGLDDAKVIKI
jgi:hypothetical protein